MDELELNYDSMDEVPESFRSFYAEGDDGRATLNVRIRGLAGPADVERLKLVNRKAREEARTNEARAKAYGDLDPEEATRLRDENEDLKLRLEAADGKGLTDDQINQLVEKRLPMRLRPVERENEKLKRETEELRAENDGFRADRARNTILGDARDATKGDKGIKLRETALEDWEMFAERVLEVNEDGEVRTKEGVGVTPGISAAELLADIQANGTRKHWFPESRGAGARGGDPASGGGPNPFAKETWNRTEQARMIQANPDRAVRFAKAAGREDLVRHLTTKR